MELPIRPIITGLLAAVATHYISRWLRRKFPPSRKPHSLSWYEERYGWVEKACLGGFLAGLSVAFYLYGTILSRNDPRGAAVGFALGCSLALAILIIITLLSRERTFRDYHDYQELKHGVRTHFTLYLVLPCLALSIYGTIHLLINGP